MLLVYELSTGKILSITYFSGPQPVLSEEVDKLKLVDGLQEGQEEVRIYDQATLKELGAAFEVSGDYLAKITLVQGIPASVSVYGEQGESGERNLLTTIAIH